jgi:uncharacterized protein (DUF305 family)
MMSAADDHDGAPSIPGQVPQDEARQAGRGVRLAGVATVLALVLVGVLAFTAGRLSAPEAAAPAGDSAAAGFARDMQVHHAQAVEMAMTVRDRTDDPDVRILAYDIALTQQQQIGQMYAWLTLWGLPQTSSSPPMEWMAQHAGEADAEGMTMGDAEPMPGAMPGMASREDLARLAQLSGRAAEVLFLELMTAHHVGGVTMAQAVLDRPAPAEVHLLAQAMVNAQNAEMTVMATMLEERGAA